MSVCNPVALVHGCASVELKVTGPLSPSNRLRSASSSARHFGDAGRTRSRGEVKQERDQGLHQQDVHEVGFNANGPERHIPGQQLIGVRRT